MKDLNKKNGRRAGSPLPLPVLLPARTPSKKKGGDQAKIKQIRKGCQPQ